MVRIRKLPRRAVVKLRFLRERKYVPAEQPCALCGAAFWRRQDDADKRFCSHRCAALARRVSIDAQLARGMVMRPDDECWEWRGRFHQGYPVVCQPGSGGLVYLQVRRVVLEQATCRPVPPGRIVIHTDKCRLGPACVNWRHMGLLYDHEAA